MGPVRLFRLFAAAGLAAVPLPGCGPSLYADLARIREEIAELERLDRRVPPESPLWITEEEAAGNPALSPDDAFNRHIQDHTASIPDFVYFHVMRKLAAMTPEEIEGSCAGEFPYDTAEENPASLRGRVWHVTGTILTLRFQTFSGPDDTKSQAYSGAAYTGPGEAFFFHVVEKPPVLYLDEDMVELYGVFVKMVMMGPPERRTSVPFFLGRRLKRYV